MKKKIVMIIVVLALLGIASYFIIKKIKQKKARDNTPEVRSDNFPLKQGSTGVRVIFLQKVLNALNPMAEQLVEDGIFGYKTEARLYNLTGMRIVSKSFYYSQIDQEHTT
ncbi:MAG: hypothetical protein LBI45_07230 [Bacteroidales bacterium]|jgi:hypothetical protein|nr:hypothetical protein [Bacteroidales bacterium]